MKRSDAENKEMMPSAGKTNPKLILHFDIRNTMIVADTVTSITVEQALNAYLTGVLWGSEVESNSWVWASTKPTLLPPSDGATTYYKHLEKMIVRTPVDRVALRLAVGDFVHTEIGESFQHYHTKHLKLLEWHHKHRDPAMTLKGNNGKNYHYVIPAIYYLIQHLHEAGQRFSIVIRTYGLDCENVLNSLQHSITTKRHPLFPNLPDLKLRPVAGEIERRDDNEIELKVLNADGVAATSLTDETEIYEYLCQVEGIVGFKDDFVYWQNHDYDHKCAKPLWVDPDDRDHLHIIFDDNYRPDTIDSIVNVRQKTADGTWQSLDIEELHKYHDMSLIQVDLLEAIADDNYYVDKVNECLKKFHAH